MGMVKLLFSFRGRINRSQYWLGGLVIFAVGLIAVVGAVSQIANVGLTPEIIPVLLALGALYLVAVWCGAALNVKRLHDRGRTGYVALLVFVPALLMINTVLTSAGSPASLVGGSLLTNLVGMIINIYFLVDLGMLPSKPGPNQYGDPPAGGGVAPNAPPSVRPAGPSPAFALNSAEIAMQRAIDAQSRAPQVRVATPAAIVSPARPSAPMQPEHPAAAPAPASAFAPRAFGRR